jgi:hypothetical protein
LLIPDERGNCHSIELRIKKKGDFSVFIETYCDERLAVAASAGEQVIPYPELTGEELRVWQRYLPVRAKVQNVAFWLRDNTPRLAIEQIKKAQKAPGLFDRIEIWSRSGDPMAVGITGGEPRYFSIVRWGDAKLTLDQVKHKLQVEKWMFRLAPVAMILMFLAGILFLITHPG